MIAPELLAANLTSPPILCFFLGLVAVALKSDLRVPAQVHETLSFYLLFAIGLKGGVAISEANLTDLLLPSLLTFVLGIITCLIAFAVARGIGRLSLANSAAMAAHYGSVSAVTFMAAWSFVRLAGLPYDAFIPALLAILEIPAIVLAILIVNFTRHKQDVPLPKLMGEIIGGKTMVMLLGGMAIGLISGKHGVASIQSVFITPFQGALTFFLLEMGIVAAGTLRKLKGRAGFIVIYGTLMPLIFAPLGALVGLLSGMEVGSVAILATMAASASYIAAPAVVKIAIPDAEPSFYLTASLGVTLPFNLIIGIPLYYEMAKHLSVYFPIG